MLLEVGNHPLFNKAEKVGDLRRVATIAAERADAGSRDGCRFPLCVY